MPNFVKMNARRDGHTVQVRRDFADQAAHQSTYSICVSQLSAADSPYDSTPVHELRHPQPESRRGSVQFLNPSESHQAMRFRTDSNLVMVKADGQDGLQATTGNGEEIYENRDSAEGGNVHYRDAEGRRISLNGLRTKPGRNLMRANGMQTEVINRAQPAILPSSQQ